MPFMPEVKVLPSAIVRLRSEFDDIPKLPSEVKFSVIVTAPTPSETPSIEPTTVPLPSVKADP